MALPVPSQPCPTRPCHNGKILPETGARRHDGGNLLRQQVPGGQDTEHVLHVVAESTEPECGPLEGRACYQVSPSTQQLH